MTSPATETQGVATPELLTLLLADARLPVAGHTQSNTLEGAVLAGLGAADVATFVRARLLGVTRVEAGTAGAARAGVVHGWGVRPVERAWAARTASPALREASRVQARTLRRLAGSLWPASVVPLAPEAGGVARPARAVVLGAVAAHLGLDAAQTARIVAYDDVQTVCAAALKLLPLDPLEVTGWVADALPGVAAVVDAVVDVELPGDVPALAAPQIEVWAQAHARTTRRLFRA
ncbi:urease accessory protein UreF [Nocardioides sp.]|uniref:urease accessory protein UreF n=1 Tax=Nocardioides sp. TaxID=35761 RepID=UPI003511CAD6